MDANPVHLAKSCCHDEDIMWCSDILVPMQQTRDIVEATCIGCLRMARDYGVAAEMRIRMLRRERGQCPVLAHADDCDCDGSAGDR